MSIEIMIKFKFGAFCLVAVSLYAWSAQAIEFPGPAAGAAQAKAKGDTFTLSNRLLSASWQTRGGQLHLTAVSNRLSTKKPLAGQREIFRLSTRPAPVEKVEDGFYLGWRVDEEAVSALYGDGKSWRLLQSFSRTLFPGSPTLLRVGKMSLKADSANYSETGAMGTARIEDLQPSMLGEPQMSPLTRLGNKIGFDSKTLHIDAATNTTAFAQWTLPPNIPVVSARIWKGSDQGQSWGPGLALVWPNGRFALVNARIPLGQFSVATPEGESVIDHLPAAAADYDLPAAAFRLMATPTLRKTHGAQELVANFRHPNRPITVQWKAILKDASHYLRQKVTISAQGDAGALTNVELLDFPVAGTQQQGVVPGSPLAGANWFFGAELPVGSNDTTGGAHSSIACQLPLTAGVSYDFGSVAGVYPQGQLRRSLLAYIERERARATAPFLHYNGWYDFAQKVNDRDLRASIAAFNQELIVKRGVKLDSYVIDDGWDDARSTFWGVDSKKFPNGFAPVADELKKIDSHLGLWISPLGGYDESKLRTDNARQLGLVQPEKPLDLSFAPYYNWWRDEHLKLMRDYQVNYFKWDRAGDGVNPHFMALIRAANELRRTDPNLFINVTVGTWPSPFWLNHIDTTWRGGSDINFAGPGNKREQWLNYRDGTVYERVVKPGPLYPLNSMMHHGIALGLYYQGKDLAPAGPDLKNDARSYFATGAALQELYLTPALMSQQGWDEVAAGAKWSRANFDVLADSHWIGGDPAQQQVYGYASWAPRKGIFMLRNPSDKPGAITLDAAQIFELPQGAVHDFKLVSPYADQRVPIEKLRAGKPVQFNLNPFEVLVFEALPDEK